LLDKTGKKKLSNTIILVIVVVAILLITKVDFSSLNFSIVPLQSTVDVTSNIVTYDAFDKFGNPVEITISDKPSTQIQAIVLTPTVAKPGEQIEVEVNLEVPLTQEQINKVKILLRNQPGTTNYNDFFIVSTDLGFGGVTSYVTTSFKTPSTEGGYEIVAQAFTETNTLVVQETEAFSVESGSDITCPPSISEPFELIFRTNDGHGDVFSKETTTFTSAPECKQQFEREYETRCDSNYIISGTSSKIAPGIKTCEPISGPEPTCTESTQVCREGTGDGTLDIFSCTNGKFTLTAACKTGATCSESSGKALCSEPAPLPPIIGPTPTTPTTTGTPLCGKCSLPSQFGDDSRTDATCETGWCMDTSFSATDVCAPKGTIGATFPSIDSESTCSAVFGAVALEAAETTGLGTTSTISASDLDLTTEQELEASKCTSSAECSDNGQCIPFDKLPSTVQDRIGGTFQFDENVCVSQDFVPEPESSLEGVLDFGTGFLGGLGVGGTILVILVIIGLVALALKD